MKAYINQRLLQGVAATALFAAALTSNAYAADIYRGDTSLKDPAPVMAPITWAGLYIGGNIGGAFSAEDDDKFDGEFKSLFDLDDDDDGALIGGGHVGFNWQPTGFLGLANVLLGIEADINVADNIDYLTSVRGRLGFTAGDWLLYGTGGIAWLGTETKYSYNGFNFSEDDEAEGFVVGAGLEKKISDRVSLGVEGLYYNFDEEEYRHDEFTYTNDLDFWTVRGRLTIHTGSLFGGGY